MIFLYFLIFNYTKFFINFQIFYFQNKALFKFYLKLIYEGHLSLILSLPL